MAEAAVSGQPLQGKTVQVPSASGPVLGLEYRPASAAYAIVIMLAGSNGGMGPGLAGSTALEMHKSASGSIYRRIAAELAAGEELDWEGRRKRAGVGGLSSQLREKPCACLHITWRRCAGYKKWPDKKFRHLSSLRDSTSDVVAAVEYMAEKYPGLKIFLLGFSFGGPSALAAVRRLPCVEWGGIVIISGSARGGERFAAEELDTCEAVRILSAAQVQILFLASGCDKNVPAEVTAMQWHAASSPRMLVTIEDSRHMLDTAREQAYGVLMWWLTEALQPHPTEFDNVFVLPLKIKGAFLPDSLVEIAAPPEPDLAEMQHKSFKGYSE